MKINKYNKTFFIRLILVEFFISFIATVVVVLMHLRVLPRNGQEWRFESFGSLRQALFYWLAFFVVMSLASMVSVYFGRNRGKRICICPSCEEPQEVTDTKSKPLCKKCGIPLVPLKGFYDKKRKEKTN